MESQEGVVPVNDVVEEEVHQSTESIELERTRVALQRSEEDRKRLEEEVTQVKEMLKREIAKAEEEICRNHVIITEYKQICSQLSLRLEKEQASSKEIIESIRVRNLSLHSLFLLYSTYSMAANSITLQIRILEYSLLLDYIQYEGINCMHNYLSL
ncbi:hypothetical protein J437_LFUL007747 [Ladona fulva]|uniref:Uncharacterized protein n=1 Tax=Ladona fulva TaxID=123851 RepID=A0A8K0KIE0_LADFU|nr:hypothetical protein J437_LFUL007747 [Ladona fulva]